MSSEWIDWLVVGVCVALVVVMLAWPAPEEEYDDGRKPYDWEEEEDERDK